MFIAPDLLPNRVKRRGNENICKVFKGHQDMNIRYLTSCCAIFLYNMKVVIGKCHANSALFRQIAIDRMGKGEADWKILSIFPFFVTTPPFCFYLKDTYRYAYRYAAKWSRKHTPLARFHQYLCCYTLNSGPGTICQYPKKCIFWLFSRSPIACKYS